MITESIQTVLRIAFYAALVIYAAMAGLMIALVVKFYIQGGSEWRPHINSKNSA